MTRSFSLLGVSSLLALLCCPGGFAFQATTVEPSVGPRLKSEFTASALVPEAHLRIDSSLVLIPVHVTTPDGASVTNLTRQNFKLTEDSVAQTITTFSKDDAPVSLGLVFDTSGSMHNKIRKAAETVAKFFKTANPGDEFFLVEFNEKPRLTVPFTPDSNDIYRRIARARPFGRTSLLDAIHISMLEMKKAHNFRKALVILSDGGDNRSRFTEGEIRRAMAESDLQLFAMGIFEQDQRRLTPEEQNGPQLLDDLADESGGRMYTVDRVDDLESICSKISEELRTQYVLGYSPQNTTRDGKFRQVRLKLEALPTEPKLRTFYRRGYYAPAQ
jgi:Ca-activated chloride channel family protein